MLLTTSQILEKSWKTYTSNFKKILPFIFLFAVLFFLQSAPEIYNTLEAHYGLFINSAVVILVALLAFVTIFSIISLWALAALSFFIRDLLHAEPVQKISGYLKNSKKYLWSLIFVSILVSLIIFGGALLFIVPGVIFSVWYAFITNTVLFEEKKGMEAMAASKNLVIGRWWKILWRLIVPAFLYTIIAFVLVTVILWPFNGSSIFVQDYALTDPSLLASSLSEPFGKSVPTVLLNNFVSSIIFALIIPLSTLSFIILYESAKENK
jgi:hypothetical protein